MQPSVPVIDISPWLSGGQAERAGVAAQVDAALQSVGFFLITGHGVPADLRDRVRAEARAFESPPNQGTRSTTGTDEGMVRSDLAGRGPRAGARSS